MAARPEDWSRRLRPPAGHRGEGAVQVCAEPGSGGPGGRGAVEIEIRPEAPFCCAIASDLQGCTVPRQSPQGFPHARAKKALLAVVRSPLGSSSVTRREQSDLVLGALNLPCRQVDTSSWGTTGAAVLGVRPIPGGLEREREMRATRSERPGYVSGPRVNLPCVLDIFRDAPDNMPRGIPACDDGSIPLGTPNLQQSVSTGLRSAVHRGHGGRAPLASCALPGKQAGDG